MAKVFISHSSKDEELATRLANDLHQLGHDPWLDKWNIRVGDCIVTEIDRGLEQADYVVILLSPDAVGSGWVEREWKAKYWVEIEKHQTLVLPVLAKDCEIPALLRTKKYADFRDSYPVGLVNLNCCKDPVLMPIEQVPSHVLASNSHEVEVSKLLTAVQSRSVPLSVCLAQALQLARETKHSELEDFARNELSGWHTKKNGDSTESIQHRLIDAYVTFGRINFQYWGWGENAGSVFDYMEQHPEQFAHRQLAVTYPVATLESQNSLDPQKGFIQFSVAWGMLDKQAKDPDFPLAAYARGDTFQRVLNSIRQVLTQLLIDMLPSGGGEALINSLN